LRMVTKFIAVKEEDHAHGISFKKMVSAQDAQLIKDIIISAKEDVFIALRLNKKMSKQDGARKNNLVIGKNTSKLEITHIVLAQESQFQFVLNKKMTLGSMFILTLLCQLILQTEVKSMFLHTRLRL